MLLCCIREHAGKVDAAALAVILIVAGAGRVRKRNQAMHHTGVLNLATRGPRRGGGRYWEGLAARTTRATPSTTMQFLDANAIEVKDEKTLVLNLKEAQVAVPEHFFHYPFLMIDPQEGGTSSQPEGGELRHREHKQKPGAVLVGWVGAGAIDRSAGVAVLHSGACR